MNKYAMVPINRKYDFMRNLYVRRVLISYEGTSEENGITYYTNTRLVEIDPYLKNTHSSHQYLFYNDGYVLQSVEGERYQSDYVGHEDIFQRRKYHNISVFDIKAIEFEAETDQEAKLRFIQREELR